MLETRLDYIQREVSSCDTEAGKRLRYHITRGKCCPDYYRDLCLHLPFEDDFIFKTAREWKEIDPQVTSLFVFNKSKEGHDYWYRIFELLEDRNV